jgi:hypothetical protein
MKTMEDLNSFDLFAEDPNALKIECCISELRYLVCVPRLPKINNPTSTPTDKTLIWITPFRIGELEYNPVALLYPGLLM